MKLDLRRYLLSCGLIMAINNISPTNIYAAESIIPVIEEQQTKLSIFVSTSMQPSLLKYYAKETARYGAVMVFKGLPGNSWAQLAQLIDELSAGGTIKLAAQIDDPAFTKYNIATVPHLVLARQRGVAVLDADEEVDLFDQVSGNIGIKRALEIIQIEGELKEEATSILARVSRKLNQE